MYYYKSEKFEGPLQLLLELIEQEKLEITEISLSQVADQFIEHIKKNERINPAELADFLVVAAKLLYLKSKVLLPSLFDETEEDPAEELKKQLAVYKRYLEASRDVNKLFTSSRIAFARAKLPVSLSESFYPPPSLETGNLREVFLAVIRKIEPIIRLPKEGLKKVISIREKIEHIREIIMTKIRSGFRELTRAAKSKTEVLVTFLALLELVKQQTIIVEQSSRYGDIEILLNDANDYVK